MENLDELQNELSNGLFPIVYLRLSSQNTHAVVVTEITKKEISVLDPEIGERNFDLSQFVEYWSSTRGLTLLIE